MAAEPLLAVDEALRRVLAAAAEPLPAEEVAIEDALDRTLAAPLAATRTQPPFPASAMDGYAVRAADATVGATLRVIGKAPAGRAFPGKVGPGEAVRIFTGAPVPEGADAILIQENATPDGDAVTVREGVTAGAFVRSAGLDFRTGEELLAAGHRLNPRTVALAAAMGQPRLSVRRKPRVAILATGDELVRPGEAARPDQIVTSNSYALAAIARRAGAEPIDLGIAGDTFAALEGAIETALAREADVLVTLGGASVGDHDLVQSALTQRGMQLGFWRIAMRPGKPLIFGQMGAMRILGLPGNPVASILCGRLFLVPLLRSLQGDPQAGDDPTEPGLLGADIPANDRRQDYLRARFEPGPDGRPVAFPAAVQDSSMLRILAQADGLVLRPPHAPAAKAGEACRVLRF
ncbi:molybdopterin molybdenumtransferase MoeA [Alsobacter metallidurans]|uniref:Molybdopterin molybdenumtransferase n=1 Tax=Alsobacter metallidurans TaxID=340221 RepID=A0A917MHS9_9HYPH|nr:gephyrin-like molybdotransferase Glp [Alsobacter metallidurans]GGH16877.1 molybdopterin molybdenumtransferase MoeA [Alsobacter metallidurans]